jgi:hypothetical protein
LQYCLEIKGRAADDLEHVGGRGLLLQGFGQITSTRLYFVEQPHVLDRNYRLVGEGRDQLNLLVCEGIHLIAREREDTDRCALAQ